MDGNTCSSRSDYLLSNCIYVAHNKFETTAKFAVRF